MIEKDIETSLVTKLNGLNIQGLDVVGLWQPSINGVLKGTEQCEKTGLMLINVKPKTFETFGISECSMDIDFVLTVRIDMCTTGTELNTIVDSFSNVLSQWNMTQSGQELTDFTVTGFYPGGLMITGGSGPTLERDKKTWTVLWSIKVVGSITNSNQSNE